MRLLRRNPGHLDSVRSAMEHALEYGHGFGGNQYEGFCGDLLERFREDYPDSADDELELYRGDTLYYGRNVVWHGTKGRMLRVDDEYLTHIDGNTFDGCKLAGIVEAIKELPFQVHFYPGYCDVNVVGPLDIAESILYQDDEGLDRPLTTGDDDLDEHLVFMYEASRKKHVVTNFWVRPDSILSATGFRKFKREWDRELGLDESDEDLMEQIRDAIANGDGDLGAITVQIRDGNHRSFGALLAGEPYIWVMASDSVMQNLKQYPRHPDSKIIRAALE